MPVEQREPEKIRAARAPKHKVEPALMVKSNALMLATTTFNVGLEYRISRRLSLDVPLLISPYTISERYRIRTWGVQPELRYWPGRFAMPLAKGHFIGLHAHVSAFNVAGGDRRYQDPNRALWGVGLSWGCRRERRQ